MKKVGSNTNLCELGAHSPAHSSQFVRAPKLMPKSSSAESLTTKALHYAAIQPTPAHSGSNSDVVFAVMSKGLAASECLIDIEELESAPALGPDGPARRGDLQEVSSQLASCMATPVVPDVGNGELVAGKAAELEAESAKEVEIRYLKETSLVKGRERRLSRKRSRDLLSEKDKELLDGDEGVGKVIERIEEKNTHAA
jgi:hypothetical protein